MDMHVIKIQVKIVVDRDGNSFHAYCPDLKGLHACGETEEQALSHAVEGVQLYLESLIKHNDPIPVGVIDVHFPLSQFLRDLKARLSPRSSSYVREVELPMPA